MRSPSALGSTFLAVPSQLHSSSLLLLLHCFITGKTSVCVTGELFSFFFFLFDTGYLQEKLFSSAVFVFYNLCIRNVMGLRRKQSSGTCEMYADTNLPSSSSSSPDAIMEFMEMAACIIMPLCKFSVPRCGRCSTFYYYSD